MPPGDRPAPASGQAEITILVVDDEESFVEALSLGLQREGFAVQVARDGLEALQVLDRTNPDLVLLDLMLPGLSGIDVCRQIRARSVPVIVVTAKSSEVDAVVSLEVGADDYVPKPYRLHELIARIRAVLRRRQRDENASVDEGGGTPQSSEVPRIMGGGPLIAGSVKLDPDRHRTWIRDVEVYLPPKEFLLLQVLIDNEGRVMERHSLLERVWGFDYEGDPRTLDVHIKRLRSKVEEDPARPRYITTVRGIGYRFEGDSDQDRAG